MIVQENTEPLQYKITSVGYIGKKTRAVAQTITVNLGSGTETGPAFQMPLLSTLLKTSYWGR